MAIKNRKFNVAGRSFYEARFRVGSLVYFRPEPDNPEDKCAIQVVNKANEVIGYVPETSAPEFLSFKNGKHRHYCAKIVEVWDGNELKIRVPKVYARFSNSPEELPFPEQEWLP